MSKIILLLLFLANISFSAEIKGKVLDSYDDTPIPGATVILYNLSELNKSNAEKKVVTGCCAKANGEYSFSGIKAGEYFIIVRQLGLRFGKEEIIKVSDSNSVVERNLYCNCAGEIKVDTDAVIENYHRYLHRNTPENIMQIKIDSVLLVNNSFKVYSSFVNKTDRSIYLVYEKSKDYTSLFNNFEVYDENNNLLHKYEPYIDMGHDCVQFDRLLVCLEKIEIKSGESISYIPVKSHFNFSNKNDGIYKFRLYYNCKKWDSLEGGFYDRVKGKKYFPDQVEIRNLALKGKYFSNNMIVIKKIGDNIEFLRIEPVR